MGFGLFYTSCGNNNGQKGGQDLNVLPAAVVGKSSVLPNDVTHAADMMLSQNQMGSMASVSPRFQVIALSQGLSTQIQALALAEVAAQMGVKVDDSSILAIATKQVDDGIKDARQQFITSGKLKADADEKAFIEVFKKERGMTPEDFRKSTLDGLGQRLADSSSRQSILDQAAPLLVMQKLKDGFPATDAEVKASKDTLTFKRILINPTGKSAAEAQTLADKVLAEVKGGMKFEEAMNKYSNDTAMAKKTVSENVVPYQRPDLTMNPDLKSLMDLKIGDVSGVVKQPAGLAIYKLISIKSNLPPDYAKDPAKYKDQYQFTLAQAELRKRLDAATKAEPVKYPLAGFKALADYSLSMQDPMSQDPKMKVIKMLEVAKEAEAATKDATPEDDGVAALVWYVAIDDAYSAAPDKKSLEDQRIAAMQAVLGFAENFEVRMALVDAFVAKKDAAGALENLLAAAHGNVAYDTTGDTHFRAINDKIAELKKDNLLVGTAEEDLKKVQSEWRQGKIENAKTEAEMKAQNAKDQADAKIAQQKLDAENKKAMDAQKKDSAPAPSKAPAVVPGTKK